MALLSSSTQISLGAQLPPSTSWKRLGPLRNLNAANLIGNLQNANFNSGVNANSSTFWRGDGVWATPSSGSATNGILNASPANGNNAWTDIAAAAPAFKGQQAISYYGNITPCVWTAYGTGVGQFHGSRVFPGVIFVGDSTHMNPNYDISENPFIVNGTSATLDPTNLSNPADNVISLKNQHLQHYSAMRWLSADADGLGERGAIGYGNSRSIYPKINYLEDYGNESGFYFVTASAGICFGMERSTGDLVRCRSGTGASNETANVVFRVNSVGSIAQSASASDSLGTVTEGNTTVNGSLNVSGNANAGGTITAFGVGSLATNTAAIASTGWTNTTSVNMEADVVATAATYTVYNAAGTPVFTNMAFTGVIPHILQPGGKITAASGLGGSAHAF